MGGSGRPINAVKKRGENREKRDREETNLKRQIENVDVETRSFEQQVENADVETRPTE